MHRQTTTSVPIYVPHEMLLKEGPVTITTMKLKIQLDARRIRK